MVPVTTNQIMVKNHQHYVMDEPYISYVGPMYWICSFSDDSGASTL